MSYQTAAYESFLEMLGASRQPTPEPGIHATLAAGLWIRERERESRKELQDLCVEMEMEEIDEQHLSFVDLTGREKKERKGEEGEKGETVAVSEENHPQEEEELAFPAVENENEQEEDVEVAIWTKEQVVEELAFRGNLQRDFVVEGFNGARIPYYLMDQTYESHMQFGPVLPSDYNYPEEPWFKAQGKGLSYFGPGVVQLGEETGPLLKSYPGKNPTNGRKNVGVVSLLIEGEEVNKPQRTCLSEVFGCYPDEDRIHVIRGSSMCWADFVEDDSGLVLMWHVSKERFGNSKFLSASRMKNICERSGKICVFWSMTERNEKRSQAVYDRRIWDSTPIFDHETQDMHPLDSRRKPTLEQPFGSCLYRVLKRIAKDQEGLNVIHPWMIDICDMGTQFFLAHFTPTVVYIRTYEDGWSHIDFLPFPHAKREILGKNAALTYLKTKKFLGKIRDTKFWPCFARRVCYTLAVEHELQQTFWSVVEYEKYAEPKVGGAWLERKKNSKGREFNVWMANFPKAKSSIKDDQSSVVSETLESPALRRNQNIVPPRRLSMEEFHSIGILLKKREDGKYVLSLPVIPVGALKDYARDMIDMGALVECPFFVLETTGKLQKIVDIGRDFRKELADIDRLENVFRRDIINESVVAFTARLRNRQQNKEAFTAQDQEDWERIRHDFCCALFCKSSKIEFEGTDVNMALRFNYWGADHKKTPDVVIELEDEILLVDIKTTEGDSTRVVNALKEKYEGLRVGLEEFLEKKVTTAVALFDFRNRTVWIDPALHSVTDKKSLHMSTKNIFEMSKDIGEMFGDRRMLKDTGTRDLKLLARKGALFKGFVSDIFSEIEITSPPVVKETRIEKPRVYLKWSKGEAIDWLKSKGEVIPEGLFNYKKRIRELWNTEDRVVEEEVRGSLDRERIPNDEVLRSDAFRYMRTQFEVEKPPVFPYSEIADILIEESQDKDFSIVEVKDAIDARLVSRAKDRDEDSAKFNMLPILLGKGDMDPPQYYMNNDMGGVFHAEISAQFTDGTRVFIPNKVSNDDPKHRKPVDVGLHPSYEKDFDDFVSYLCEGTNLSNVAFRVTELYENISYMEGRRAAAAGYMTADDRKKHGRLTKASLRKTGLTVSKTFEGYTLVLRAGSRLTAEKQVKVMILAAEGDSFLDRHYLKKPRTDKWYTVSLSHIENLVRANELLAGLRALRKDTRWVATAFSFYLFMRPVTAELLQNARYVWLSSMSYQGDKMGLISTVVPSFWTARIDSVVVGKLAIWWKTLLSEMPQQCKLREEQEILDHLEYSHMTFPSFYNPKIRVPSEITIDEIYTCNLSSRQNGFQSHKEGKMVAKLLECELKWRKMERHYVKRTPMEVFKDPGMFKYSAEGIAAVFQDMMKENWFICEPWERFLNKMTLGIDELATMKSSVAKESVKIGENNRKRAAENFYALYRKTGLVGICSNISYTKEWPRFVNDLFPKAQIGTREITILHYMARLQIWVAERLMESFNFAHPSEMITEKNKEEIQVSIMSSFREQRLEAAKEGKNMRYDVHCLDATRWSPGFNVAHFGEMANNMNLPPYLLIYLMHTLRCVQKKRVRMPESWATAIVKRSEEDKKQFELDGTMELREEVQNQNGYLDTDSGMGQGILHQMSSFYHTGLARAEEITIRVIAEKLNVKVVQMHTLLSSDDKTRFVLSLAPNGRTMAVFSRASWKASIRVSPIGNIHANKKKSASGGIAEFNSFFMVGKKPHYALIKDVYSATAVVDYTYPEKAVESKLGDIRRLIEHGMTIEKLIPFVRVLRGTMIRRYTYRSPDIVFLCELLKCSQDELPTYLGFLPADKDVLAACIYNKEILCFRGSDELRLFHHNFFSNTKVGRYNENFFGGKHTVSLDTAFDNRMRKMREALTSSLGMSSEQVAALLEQTALSKISGSSDPYKMMSTLSMYPMQLMDDDPMSVALPVHSLVRAAQAARKVKIDGYEGYAKGLVDAARMILSKESTEGGKLKSNLSYFKTAISMSRTIDMLTSKLDTCRFRESHQRRKPRRYNITPGGEGTHVSTQSFIRDIMCTEEARLSTLKRIQKLEESSGTLLRTDNLSKDPMKFLYENFVGEAPLQSAEKFFSYFLGKQNFPMIRIALTTPPKASGEENIAIILSEIYKEGLVAKLAWETTDEESVSSDLLLYSQVNNVPEVISTAAPRNVQRICMWAGYHLNQTDFTYPCMFFESSNAYLTISRNAVAIRTKITPERETSSISLHIRDPTAELDPVFVRLVESDIQRYRPSRSFHKVTAATFKDSSGLIFSKSFPLIRAKQTDQGTKRILSLDVGGWRFVVLEIQDKTPFVSASLPSELFKKKEDLVEYLSSIRLPLSQATQETKDMIIENKVNIGQTNAALRAALARFAEEYQEDDDYGIDDLLEEKTDPLSQNIAKMGDLIRNVHFDLLKDREEEEYSTSNTVFGTKLAVNNFILKHFREKEGIRNLTETELYVGILGHLGENFTNTSAIHCLFSPRISAGEKIPNAVNKRSMDSIRWYTDREEEPEVPDEIVAMIEMFAEPVELTYMHVEYPKLGDTEEAEGIIEIAEAMRSEESFTFDFESAQRHVKAMEAKYGKPEVIPEGESSSSFDIVAAEIAPRLSDSQNVPGQKWRMRDALSAGKKKISAKMKKIGTALKKSREVKVIEENVAADEVQARSKGKKIVEKFKKLFTFGRKK